MALVFLLRVFLFLLIIFYKNEFTFYIFSIGFGFTLLFTAPIGAMLPGKMYGFANIGLISCFITTVHHIAGGAWAYTGGLVFDISGSYQIVFVLSLVMAAVAVLSSMLIKEQRHPKPAPGLKTANQLPG